MELWLCRLWFFILWTTTRVIQRNVRDLESWRHQSLPNFAEISKKYLSLRVVSKRAALIHLHITAGTYQGRGFMSFVFAVVLKRFVLSRWYLTNNNFGNGSLVTNLICWYETYRSSALMTTWCVWQQTHNPRLESDNQSTSKQLTVGLRIRKNLVIL